MGKRKKSARKPEGPKKKVPLPSTFACLFCNHESSITVTLNKKAGTGELSCKICGQHFQTGINYLSAAVDVYSDWVDACDAVAKDGPDTHGEGWERGAASRGQQGDSELEDAPAARSMSEDAGELDYEAV